MTISESPRIVLRTRGAQVVYPNGTTGIQPTDFCVSAGEYVVLLGSSGAGKSTLLRALNGLVPLSAGALEVEDGTTLRSAAAWRAHRQKTGMVFQQHQLIGRLSVLANVLTGRLGYHGALRTLFPFPRADRIMALEALDRVGLLDYALKRADELSGGQQQRVGIARALAQAPCLMLADEPVASLDPASAAHVLTLIRDVCKADGIAAVVSLHQVDLARQFADRIVGMAGGAIVFDGAPQDLGSVALERLYGRMTSAPARNLSEHRERAPATLRPRMSAGTT